MGWGNLDGVELGLGAADAFDGDDVAAVDAAERREARVDRLVNHLQNVQVQSELRWPAYKRKKSKGQISVF